MIVSGDDGKGVETDFLLNHEDLSNVGDINCLYIVGIIDKAWLGCIVSAVSVSYLLGCAYHVGVLGSLCAIHPFQGEFSSNKPFRGGGLRM